MYNHSVPHIEGTFKTRVYALAVLLRYLGNEVVNHHRPEGGDRVTFYFTDSPDIREIANDFYAASDVVKEIMHRPMEVEPDPKDQEILPGWPSENDMEKHVAEVNASARTPLSEIFINPEGKVQNMAINSLKRGGIYTIESLVEHSYAQIWEVPGIGKCGMEYIMSTLSAVDLYLK